MGALFSTQAWILIEIYKLIQGEQYWELLKLLTKQLTMMMKEPEMERAASRQPCQKGDTNRIGWVRTYLGIINIVKFL